MRGFALVAVVLAARSPLAAADRAVSVLDAPALVVEIDAARRAGDVERLEALVRVSAEAHNRCRTAGARSRLRTHLGEIVRGGPSEGVRSHAADALGLLDDRAAAWRELRRVFPDPRGEVVSELGRRVLRSVGLLMHDPGVDDLKRFVREGRDPEAVGIAAEALGRFRFSRVRVAILGALHALGRDAVANPARGAAPEDDVRQAWIHVVARTVAAMDHMTGRRVGSLDRWTRLLEEHEGRWDELFETPAR